MDLNKEMFRENAYRMIALTRCAVNGEVPDSSLTAEEGLDALFAVCQEHILTACTAYALESAGVQDAAFTQAKNKAIRKNILLDAERKNVLEHLAQAKIWYMPLKGSVLKDWYPKLGMRQMADNDILFDSNYRREVKDVMEACGFTCEHYGYSHNDDYRKPPVSNFEMHPVLFEIGTTAEPLYQYYKEKIPSVLQQDDTEPYLRRFRNEDFYVYLAAHEYMHFKRGGTGVRSLLDTYIFMRRCGDAMDWDYIQGELKTLGIADFEMQNRKLAMKVYQGEMLDDADKALLDYYIFSGVYGTIGNTVKNRVDVAGSKGKYIFRRIFPDMKMIRTYYPFFYRHKLLIPALIIWRPFKGLFRNREHLTSEVRHLMRK